MLVDTGDKGLGHPLLLDVHCPRCGTACLPVQPCNVSVAYLSQLFPHMCDL